MRFLTILSALMVLLFNQYAFANTACDNNTIIKRILQKDPALLVQLQSYGISIHYQNQPQSSTYSIDPASMSRISHINQLSSSLTLDRWKDVRKAMSENQMHMDDDIDYNLRHESDNFCRNHYRKVGESELYYRCQFRYTATYILHQQDRQQCSRDAQATHTDTTSINQATYHCMRNAGWKDPNQWKNNVEY